MSDRNDDPILDIRIAVAETLRANEYEGDHKSFTDEVVDRLPPFFCQPLRPAPSPEGEA